MAQAMPLTLEALCTNYYGFVLRYVQTLVQTPEDAEEVTQDVFLHATQAFSSFKPVAPGNWLRTIALNQVRYRMRHAHSQQGWGSVVSLDALQGQPGVSLLELLPASCWPWSVHQETSAMRSHVEAILAYLSEQEALILRGRFGLLSDQDGILSYEDLARLLGFPCSKVRYWERRALIRLIRLRRAGLLPQEREAVSAC